MSTHTPYRRRLSLSVSELIAPTLKPLLAKRGIAHTQLVQHWPDIVGPALSRFCLPDRLSFPPNQKSHGRLFLRVASGWTLEVQHQTPVILERIAIYLGYPAVAEISIFQDHSLHLRLRRQQPTPPLPAAEEEALQQEIVSVTNEKLHESLLALGRAMKTKREKAYSTQQ